MWSHIYDTYVDMVITWYLCGTYMVPMWHLCDPYMALVCGAYVTFFVPLGNTCLHMGTHVLIFH